MSHGTQGSTSSPALSVARSTLIVIIGYVLGSVIGLIRQRIVAAAFGTTAQFDAYVAADGLSELLVTALASGTLFYAFVPIYVELLAANRRTDSNRLVSQTLNSLFLIVAAAAVLAAIAAPVLVSAPWGIGAGYSAATQALTVKIVRTLLLSMIVFALSSMLTGILHAHRHFWLPAVAPIMYHVGIIFGALFFAPKMGIMGLAWGAVLGSILHLGIQIPGVIFRGIAWQPVLGWRDPAVQKIALLMAPRIADLIMARASITWLNANLSSYLGEGRVSALSYAYRLINIPWSLIGTALGFAIFPYISSIAASGDLGALKKVFNGGIRAVLILTIPSAVGLLFLGTPLIQLLLRGGSFTEKSVDLVYYALQFYVLALISQCLLEIVVRAFAAQQDTLTPLIVSVFTTALNIGLAVWLTRPFSNGGLEHGGPPLANGIAVLVEALVGIAILRLRWGAIDAKRMLMDGLRAVLAAGCMAVAIVGVKNVIPSSPILLLTVGGVVGVVVYWFAALLFGVKEMKDIPFQLLLSYFHRPQSVEDGLSGQS